LQSILTGGEKLKIQVKMMTGIERYNTHAANPVALCIV